jgi:tetratricopeptide (TPR) repeat protein
MTLQDGGGPAAPQSCGRYLIRGELGEGGFGSVYRGWDPKHEREVAIKLLQRPSPKARERFEREIRATARLRHPNVVALLDSGEHEGKPFLVTELVRGGDLAGRCDGAGMNVEEGVQILSEVARAVAYAHEQGVLHRDLKPQNVLLDEEGRALVADFGLAKLSDGKTGLTQSGATLGTPAYMPPEQLEVSRGGLDARSDVYALGATLYHVLTGRPPFELETAIQMHLAITQEEPLPPSAWNPRVPQSLDTVCLKCLEKDPARRYLSAGELADDLDRWLAGEPILAQPVTTWERSLRWVSRRRLAVFATLGMLVLGGLSAGLILRNAQREARADQERREGRERDAEVVRQLLARAEVDPSSFAYDDALAQIGRLAGPETVGILADRLEALADELLAVEEGILLAVVEPDADEKLAGLATIEGLPQALAAWRDLPPGEALPTSAAEAIRRASERVERRAYLALDLASRERTPRLLDIVASQQGQTLGAGKLLVARLACEGLGRLGIRERAVTALGRYSRSESDGQRAVHAALALCALGGNEALQYVLSARGRLGYNSVFASRIEGALSRLDADVPLEEESARGFMRRGEARESQGDLDGALADYERATELAPDDARAWVLLGCVRFGRGELAEADAAHSRAIELDARLGPAWINRGLARAALGDPEGALADYSQAIELQPQRPQPWRARGNLHMRLGDHQQALADLGQALELDPQHVAAWVDRGHLSIQMRDLAGAERDLIRALELDPSHALAWAARGDVHRCLRQLDQAIACATRAIELDPGLVAAWRVRGVARGDRGDPGGVADLERALELAPDSREVLFDLGRAHARRGDVERELELYGQAIARAPDDASGWARRGAARARAGDVRGAEADLARALELDPGSAYAWVSSGIVRTMRQDLRGAIEAFDAALEIEPEEASAWGGRGEARRLLGDLQGAVADIERSVQLEPRQPNAWGNLGNAWQSAGDMRKAIAAYDAALDLDPRQAVVYGNRGIAKVRLGDREGALADFTKALQLDPRLAMAWSNRAKLHEQLGDLEQGLSDYDRALDLDPGYPATWGNRGMLRLRLGDVDGALSDLSRAIQLQPTRIEPHLERAMIRADRGEAKAAVADLQRYLQLAPAGHPGMARARAKLAELQGR